MDFKRNKLGNQQLTSGEHCQRSQELLELVVIKDYESAFDAVT